jgi:hypothetical protein
VQDAQDEIGIENNRKATEVSKEEPNEYTHKDDGTVHPKAQLKFLINLILPYASICM